MAYPPFPTLGMGDFGPVAPGSAKAVKPAVLTANFGDRYSQRSGDGINALPRDFTYRSSILRPDQTSALEAFLIGRKGYLPFTFLVPYEAAPRQFICPSWQVDYSSNIHAVLSATFQENFDP